MWQHNNDWGTVSFPTNPANRKTETQRVELVDPRATLEPSTPCKRLAEEPIKDTSGEFSQQFHMRFAEGVELGTGTRGTGSPIVILYKH